MFSAIVAPYVDRLSLADAPRLMGAAFLGFLAADATLIFAAGLGPVRTIGPVPRLSRTAVVPRRPAPPPGSDGPAIRAELGSTCRGPP